MRCFYRTSLLVFVLLSGIVACVLPGTLPVDPNAESTSAAQTLIAIIEATQSAVPSSFSPSSQAAASATATFTLEPPTQTPTEIVTATLDVTPTPFLPHISVSELTNCRIGPGVSYQQVGVLPVGETVQVYARDPSGKFWYIQNPDRPNEFCWVWGEHAIVTGFTSILPVYTPAPTPTPAASFDASYSGLVVCDGWHPEINLKNTSMVSFRSVDISLKDTVTSASVDNSSDGFDNPGCGSSTGRKILLPYKSVTVSAPGFAYNPKGHKIRATITLCSNNGQNGLCVTDTITFTP